MSKESLSPPPEQPTLLSNLEKISQSGVSDPRLLFGPSSFRQIIQDLLESDGLSTTSPVKINLQNLEFVESHGGQRYPWLKRTDPADTFSVAHDHIEQIFGPVLISEHAQSTPEGEKDLSVFHRVIDRAEQVARGLKQKLISTAFLDEAKPIGSGDVQLLKDAIFDVSPLALDTNTFQDQVALHQQVKSLHGYKEIGWWYTPWDNSYFTKNLQKPLADRDLKDEHQALRFYKNVFPHSVLSGVFIRKLAQSYNSIFAGTVEPLNEYLLECRMLWHDIGRWVSHHPELHDELPALIAHFVGIRADVLEGEFAYHHRYLEGRDVLLQPKRIPIEELLYFIADFFGKAEDWSNPTVLRTFSNKFKSLMVRVKQYENLNSDNIEQLLEKISGPKEKRYYKSEILMLKRVFPYLAQEVGLPLETIRRQVEFEFAKLIDSGKLVSRRIERLDTEDRVPTDEELLEGLNLNIPAHRVTLQRRKQQLSNSISQKA